MTAISNDPTTDLACAAGDLSGVTAGDSPDDFEREQRFAGRLGITFANPDLLRLALTHRSVLQDLALAGSLGGSQAAHTNERLEFYGDAVLDLVAAELLYFDDPHADEGALTRRRAGLVRAETLVRWARQLDVANALYLGHGERPSASARDRMLAGAFEAIVGAITIDQGYEAARAFLLPFLTREYASARSAELVANPKGRLQELTQEHFRLAPEYATVSTEGPAHDRTFTVAVRLGERELGRGVGTSKRIAQQIAAAEALQTLEPELAAATTPEAG